MLDLSSLNEYQRKAVTEINQSLLVVAGPGAGKTHALTWRVANTIESTPGKHFRILGLTLTEKAATEIRRKYLSLVDGQQNRINLTTYHGFAAEVLRQHGSHIGLKPSFLVLGQDSERKALLEDAIRLVDSSNNFPNSELLLPLISRLTECNVEPEDAKQILEQGSFQHLEELALIYKSYRELMIKNDQLDFNGLIAEATNLLKRNSGIRKLVNKIYTHICVDEIQNINSAQYNLLLQITSTESTVLFFVADEEQVVDQWNGANPSRLDDVRNHFRLQPMYFPETYRCPPEITQIADRLNSVYH